MTNKFLSSFIKVEKSIQIVALVGVLLFLGYFISIKYREKLKPAVSEERSQELCPLVIGSQPQGIKELSSTKTTRELESLRVSTGG
jgi:hypothetical protein